MHILSLVSLPDFTYTFSYLFTHIFLSKVSTLTLIGKRKLHRIRIDEKKINNLATVAVSLKQLFFNELIDKRKVLLLHCFFLTLHCICFSEARWSKLVQKGRNVSYYNFDIILTK